MNGQPFWTSTVFVCLQKGPRDKIAVVFGGNSVADDLAGEKIHIGADGIEILFDSRMCDIAHPEYVGLFLGEVPLQSVASEVELSECLLVILLLLFSRLSIMQKCHF